MQNLISILLILSTSWLLSCLIKGYLRDVLTPWVLAGLMVWGGMMVFVSGPLTVLGTIYYYLAVGFLTNGFKHGGIRYNTVAKSFLIFWCYMLVSMLVNPFGFTGAIYFALWLLEWIAVGYFVGLWIIRTPDGLGRIARAVAIMTTIVSYLYIKSGALRGNFEMAERMGLDEGALAGDRAANVNLIGLVMVLFLPFSFLALIEGGKGIWSQIARCFGGFNFLVMGTILLRTGSRNSSLVFVPILLFALNYQGKSRRYQMLRRIMILVCAAIAVGGILWYALHLNAGTELNEMRTFKYDQEDVTSGRMNAFADFFNELTPLQWMFGGGPHVDVIKGVAMIANGHCAHFQLFLQSGFVGLILYSCFVIAICFANRGNKRIRNLILMLFFVWFLTGVGESANIMRGPLGGKLYLGMAIAFCSKMWGWQRGVSWDRGANLGCYS